MLTKTMRGIMPIAGLAFAVNQETDKHIIVCREQVRNTLGTIEDSMIGPIEKAVEDGMCAPDAADKAIKWGLVNTDFVQMVSLITYANQAFGAMFDPLNFTFVASLIQPEVKGRPKVVYISFEDMVASHNNQIAFPEVTRLVEAVYLQRTRGGIVCTKNRVQF